MNKAYTWSQYVQTKRQIRVFAFIARIGYHQNKR